MLEADAAHALGQREKKIIMVVMVRAVELIGLTDQIAVRLDMFGFGLEQFGAIGDDVELNFRRPVRIEIEAFEIAPGIHRRIH